MGADVQALEAEAQRIQDEDLAANRHMGELGAAVLGSNVGVLTHCNTGSLATAGYGTALGSSIQTMAPKFLRRSISATSNPNSARTSAVCSPVIGARDRTPPGGSTGTSGWSWMACSAPGPSPGGRRSTRRTSGSR